jgi:Trk K+ transport system NAD-binding subunit
VAEDAGVLVRVTEAENVPKALDAGADYALSEQRATARTVARTVREGTVPQPTGAVRLLRVPTDRFVGWTLAEAGASHPAVASEPDRTVVGVVRDGRLLTDGEVEVAPGDGFVVAGTDESLRAFEAELDDEVDGA